ncbi:putative proton-dependent oligopeptide transporter family, MFS transporter superfamily [Helianthus annuus]|nr:putative proton-dependent oligopeptide transporter family, MFS transporter superfamily [Helianthus annuus]KAJ0758263.1 putative proton-dependent oligopeptide transporter family, MFS transporter superfamily [Helianthus annuus]KAJ0761924.1 putative proton-dependent oligopeptide transporter family, MFS transporter superfamily [Helianthus annuus]
MEGDSNQLKSSIHTDLQTELLVPNHHDRKGGMRTMPFIIGTSNSPFLFLTYNYDSSFDFTFVFVIGTVNEAFERLANYGLMPNMIFYLMEVYNMEVVSGTSILSIWSALSNGLSIFGAFISDSYLGRFRVIAIGSFSALLVSQNHPGMIFLWLTSVVPQLTPSCDGPDTSCNPPSLIHLVFLYTCFILLSIGSGCIRPCSIAFGADQLKHHPSLSNERVIERYFNWYYASVSISTIIALTAMVYIQEQLGWQVGFAIAVLIMLCSALMFVLGSSLYVKVKASESLFTGLVQVLVVAFNNRRIHLLPDDCYNHSEETDQVELTDNLRFLNKACVLRDLNPNSSKLDPWSVSTIEKVESLKSLIRVLPLWSTGILIFTTMSQTFPTLQAKTMNRHVTSWFEVPAASFNIFMIMTLTIWIAFYDFVLAPFLVKYTHQPRGLHPKTRMGIGLVIAIVAMIVSAIVEIIRRNKAGLNTTVDMSAMWLVPQYALFGLAEAFNSIGQMEFYYSELSKSMSSIAISLFMVSNAISGLVGSLLVNVVDALTTKGGNISWLSSDINEGHLDYYYWLLSFLNLLNFLYYLVCCRVHWSSSSSDSRLREGSDFRH